MYYSLVKLILEEVLLHGHYFIERFCLKLGHSHYRANIELIYPVILLIDSQYRSFGVVVALGQKGLFELLFILLRVPFPKVKGR
jgi:hypothetical protein